MADSGRVRALIVDDEPIARAGLRRMLAEFGWLECAGEAASGPAALESLERLRPELMFLDIEMPGLSGIEVLRQAPHAPLVVFTTAYAEHAVTAFELGALDYLLKPFGPERLAAALERVRATLGEPAPPAFERLRETWSQGPIRRLFVRSGRAIVPLAVESVRCFEAVGDYVAAHAGQRAASAARFLAAARIASRPRALRAHPPHPHREPRSRRPIPARARRPTLGAARRRYAPCGQPRAGAAFAGPGPLKRAAARRERACTMPRSTCPGATASATAGYWAFCWWACRSTAG
jgi:two-component system LytT family response regulator